LTVPSTRPLPTTRRTGGLRGSIAVWSTMLATAGLWALTLASGLVSPLPAWAVLTLTLLPWLAVALMAWAFTLWTLVPDHPAAGWLFALSLAAPAAQWGPVFPARPTAIADEGTPLTVVTWNVRRLWGAPEAEGDATTCIVEALTAEDPDVVLLQEVSSSELAKLVGPLDLDCIHGTYAEADPVGSAGLAVCSRGDRWRRTGGTIDRFRSDEDWRFVRATVGDGTHELSVLGVHLFPYRILHDPVGSFASAASRFPATTAAQQAQADQLLTEAGMPPERVVLGGDFNATRDTPIHARLRRALDDTWEVGGQGFGATVRVLDAVPMRIDYLYASHDIGVVDSEIPDVSCSDHAPIRSELRVR
jgi:endonuclease/exonuclease/phosphatase (EEP) superfamily protein YafD